MWLHYVNCQLLVPRLRRVKKPNDCMPHGKDVQISLKPRKACDALEYVQVEARTVQVGEGLQLETCKRPIHFNHHSMTIRPLHS